MLPTVLHGSRPRFRHDGITVIGLGQLRSVITTQNCLWKLKYVSASVKFSANLAMERRMNLKRDIQSLSTFKRDTARFVRQMKKTGAPVVLTVNGKAELVVQDAENYQELLEAKDRMEAIAGIQRGLDSLKRNGGKPARKFFTEFFAEQGIPGDE
jgi:prevent-host-death family protein